MKIGSIIAAVLALIAGGLAAYRWYQSAASAPPPLDSLATFVREGNGATPLERWLANSALRNKSAAMWSAVAAVLAAVSSLLGAAP